MMGYVMGMSAIVVQALKRREQREGTQVRVGLACRTSIGTYLCSGF